VLRIYVKELCAHQKLFKKGSEVTAYEKQVNFGSVKQEEAVKQEATGKKSLDKKEDKSSIFIKKFPGTEERTKQNITKMNESIKREEQKLSKKEENKSIALGTSKINYNDPRITVAWCKKNEVPIEKVFTKALRTKFPWAMYCEPDWKF